MGTVGLTRGQFTLDAGSNKYSPLQGTFQEPTPSRRELWHEVTESTVIPHKDLGPERPTVSGTVLLTSATADTFKNAVLTTSARYFRWHNGTQEVYIKVYSGRITSDQIVFMDGSSTVYRKIGFAFTAYDTRLYKGSDDSVIWGA